jgi:hypothetical protein
MSMANIPTASRIFADRYFREARRLEALHAARIAPGTATWGEALNALVDRMEKVGSPIKRAAILRQAIAYLDGVAHAEAMHVGIGGSSSGKRTAALVFAAFHAGRHPLDLDEDGLHVLLHVLVCDRGGGARLLADVLLTYVSKHAMARLHERNYQLTAGSAFTVFGHLGILGLLTHRGSKHVRGAMCLRHGEILAVGSLKQAAAGSGDDQLIGGSFLDIRTVLPADEVRDHAMLEQGRIAEEAVVAWLDDRTIAGAEALAERIPFLPRREDDFTLRAAR